MILLEGREDLVALDGEGSGTDRLSNTVVWLQGVPSDVVAELLYDLVVSYYKGNGPSEKEFFREINQRVERIIQC